MHGHAILKKCLLVTVSLRSLLTLVRMGLSHLTCIKRELKKVGRSRNSKNTDLEKRKIIYLPFFLLLLLPSLPSSQSFPLSDECFVLRIWKVGTVSHLLYQVDPEWSFLYSTLNFCIVLFTEVVIFV